MEFTCYINEHITNITNLKSCAKVLDKVISACVNALMLDNKIVIAGNGGSAADASHFAGELVGRLDRDRRSLPAISLAADSSTLTCIANDFGFQNVFSRQIGSIGKRGDIFFGISTSGKSENVIRAMKEARSIGLTTIFLTGKDFKARNNFCDYLISVPSNKTNFIQEMHIMIIHYLCFKIEQAFLSN